MSGVRNLPPARAVACAMGLIIAVTVGRVWLVDHLPDQGWFAKYPAIAQGLWAGAADLDRFGDVSSGYLAVVGALHGGAGLSVKAIRSLQVVVVSIVAAMCAWVAWRLWGGLAAVVAATIVLTSRAALVNATELEPETLMLLLVSAALSVFLVGGGWRSGAVAGVFFALAFLTRPTVGLPLVLLLVGAWRGGADSRFRRQTIALAASALVVVLAAKTTATLVRGESGPSMNPGTVFYESWNPSACGYAGEAPAVVKDVEHALALPDGLHVAYRLVAGLAEGGSPDARTSNSFWGRRGVAFISAYPTAAAQLLARKAALALHSHDAWDLASMQRKDENLRRLKTWLPFGVAAACAAAACLIGFRRQEVVCLGLWLAGSWAVMVLFYVTSRQRNALLPAVALLGAFAVSDSLVRWRKGNRREVLGVAAAVLVASVALSIDRWPQSEDHHTWQLRFVQERAVREIQAAEADHDADRSSRWRARAAVALLPIGGDPPAELGSLVREELRSAPAEPRVFDLAMVLMRLGKWREAERLLEQLEAAGYRPWRGARWTSSLAYHRARCRLAQNDLSGAEILIRKADRQAPGDPRILALGAVIRETAGDEEFALHSRTALARLHDPVTADRALADAWRDVGRFDLEQRHAEAATEAVASLSDRGPSVGGGR